jgi:hypothetical protein
MKRQQPGSIMIFCLLILAVIVIFTEQLLRNVLVGSLFTKTMIDREHAEMLALSGVHIAMATALVDEKREKERESQQAFTQLPTEKDNDQSTDAKTKNARTLLTRLLPNLNRWKTYDLTEKVEGFDGQIKVCISAEDGKININNAFDFKKQEFKKEYQAFLQGLEIPGKLKAGEILKRLTEFLSKRKKRLDDISELSLVPGLEQLDIFYSPPQSAAKNKKSEPNAELMLQDIFTIWSSGDSMDVMVLSDALCAILGLRRPAADDASKLKNVFKQITSSFNPQWSKDWENNWKSIEPLYGEKPKFLKEVNRIFSKEFGPRVYSVLSCGKVGHVEQKLLAIIREVAETDPQADKNNQPQDQKNIKDDKAPSKGNSSKQPPAQSRKSFKIEKIYWL